MANGNGTSRFIFQLAMVLIGAAVVWGALQHQVKSNTDGIEKKLDKEVFGMYIKQQEKASEARDKMLERMETKLDKVLEK